MKRILVVANRTLCDEHLLDEVRHRKEGSPVTFHLLVPASHPKGSWTDRQAELEARSRLDDMLDTLAVGGISATGQIGDADPVYAVQDLLRVERFDEIIVSTFPPGVSRWLGRDVIRRLRATTSLPITHVVSARTRTTV